MFSVELVWNTSPQNQTGICRAGDCPRRWIVKLHCNTAACTLKWRLNLNRYAMSQFNLISILIAGLLYVLTSGISLQDRLLVEMRHKMTLHAFVEPSADALFDGAMAGMVRTMNEQYGDHYSLYIPPSKQTQYTDSFANIFEGFGMTTRISTQDNEKTVVIDYPLLNSPAYHAGIRSGDRILKIDGEDFADKTNSEIMHLFRQSREAESALSVIPFGQTETKEILISREKHRHDSIEGDYYEIDGDTPGRVFFLEDHPQIGYVHITSFVESTHTEFGQALATIKQAGTEAFILDLRGNSGGDVLSSVQVARMLIAVNSQLDAPHDNLIATVRSRHGIDRKRIRNILPPYEQLYDIPMVVLINSETASSAEIVAAALQDYRRATVVGTRSFGKGVIQSITVLPFQLGALQLTEAEYLRPSGAGIHRKRFVSETDVWGVLPDITVEFTKPQKEFVSAYRSLRSNVVSTQRQLVLDDFRQYFSGQHGWPYPTPDEEPSSPNDFVGTAPYYDPQIDKAIEVLLGELTTQ